MSKVQTMQLHAGGNAGSKAYLRPTRFSLPQTYKVKSVEQFKIRRQAKDGKSEPSILLKAQKKSIENRRPQLMKANGQFFYGMPHAKAISKSPHRDFYSNLQTHPTTLLNSSAKLYAAEARSKAGKLSRECDLDYANRDRIYGSVELEVRDHGTCFQSMEEPYSYEDPQNENEGASSPEDHAIQITQQGKPAWKKSIMNSKMSKKHQSTEFSHKTIQKQETAECADSSLQNTYQKHEEQSDGQNNSDLDGSLMKEPKPILAFEDQGEDLGKPRLATVQSNDDSVQKDKNGNELAPPHYSVISQENNYTNDQENNTSSQYMINQNGKVQYKLEQLALRQQVAQGYQLVLGPAKPRSIYATEDRDVTDRPTASNFSFVSHLKPKCQNGKARSVLKTKTNLEQKACIEKACGTTVNKGTFIPLKDRQLKSKRTMVIEEPKRTATIGSPYDTRRALDEPGPTNKSTIQLHPTIINFQRKRRSHRALSDKKQESAKAPTGSNPPQIQLEVLPVEQKPGDIVVDHFDQTQLMGQTQYLANMDPIYPEASLPQEQRGRNRPLQPASGKGHGHKGMASEGFYAITNKDLITPGIESDLSSTRYLGLVSASEQAEYAHNAAHVNEANAQNGSGAQGTETSSRGAFRPQKIQKSKKLFYERSHSLALVSRLIRPTKKKQTPRPANEDLNCQSAVQEWPHDEQGASDRDYINIGGLVAQEGKLADRTQETASVNKSQEYSGKAMPHSQKRLLTNELRGNTASRYTVKFQTQKEKSEGSPRDYNADGRHIVGQSQTLNNSQSAGTRTAEFRGQAANNDAHEEAQDPPQGTNIYTSIEVMQSQPDQVMSEAGDGEPEQCFTSAENIARIASKEGNARHLGLTPYGVHTENRGSRSGVNSDRQTSQDSVIQCIEQNGKMYQEAYGEQHNIHRKDQAVGRVPFKSRFKRPTLQPMTLREKGHQAIQSELARRAMILNRKTVDVKPVNLGVVENLLEDEDQAEEACDIGKKNDMNAQNSELTSLVEASAPDVSQDKAEKPTDHPSTVQNEKSHKQSINAQISRDQFQEITSNSYIQKEEQEAAEGAKMVRKNYGKDARPRDFAHQRRSDESRARKLLSRSSLSETNNHKSKGPHNRAKSFADAHPQNLMTALDHSNHESDGALIPKNSGDKSERLQNAEKSQRRTINLESKEYIVNASIKCSKEAMNSGVMTCAVNSNQILKNAQNPQEHARAFSAALHQRRPVRRKLTDLGTKRSISPSNYNADVRAVTAGIKTRVLKKKPKDKAKTKGDAQTAETQQNRPSLVRSSSQHKKGMYQPISVVNLELDAPGNNKSMDQQGFAAQRLMKKRPSHALQNYSAQKQAASPSREPSKSLYGRLKKASQTNDGETHVETLNTINSSRHKRQEAVRDSKEAGTSPLDTFGRIYEKKRMAQIQNVCIDDVVKEVNVDTSAFDRSQNDFEPSQLNTSQTHSRLDGHQLHSLLALHNNGALSRQQASQKSTSLPKKETSKTQSPDKSLSSRSKTDMNLVQAKQKQQFTIKNENGTGCSTLLITSKHSRVQNTRMGTVEKIPPVLIQNEGREERIPQVTKVYALSLANKQSTEAYQESVFAGRDLLHRVQPAKITINHQEEGSTDFFESPERRNQYSTIKRGKMSIGSSRDLRIQLSQEEHGHFDTITNRSQKHSSPQTKNRTPSQNSPDKLKQVQMTEDTLVIQPSYVHDMETQVNKRPIKSKEPRDNSIEGRHGTDSRNPAAPLSNLEDSKSGDKSNTTAAIFTSFQNQLLNDPNINAVPIEILNQDLPLGTQADASTSQSPTNSQAMAARKRSLNALLGRASKPVVVATKASRSNSPYVSIKQIPAKGKGSPEVQLQPAGFPDRRITSSFFERRSKHQSNKLKNFERRLVSQNRDSDGPGPMPQYSFAAVNIGKKANERIPLRSLIRHQKNLSTPQQAQSTLTNKVDTKRGSQDLESELNDESAQTRNGAKSFKIQQIFQNVATSDQVHEQTFGGRGQLQSSVTFGSDSNHMHESLNTSQARAKPDIGSSKSYGDRSKHMNIKSNLLIDKLSKDDLKKIARNETVYVTMDPVAQAITNGRRRQDFRSIQPDPNARAADARRTLENSYLLGYLIGLNKTIV